MSQATSIDWISQIKVVLRFAYNNSGNRVTESVGRTLYYCLPWWIESGPGGLGIHWFFCQSHVVGHRINGSKCWTSSILLFDLDLQLQVGLHYIQPFVTVISTNLDDIFLKASDYVRSSSATGSSRSCNLKVLLRLELAAAKTPLLTSMYDLIFNPIICVMSSISTLNSAPESQAESTDSWKRKYEAQCVITKELTFAAKTNEWVVLSDWVLY